MNNSVTLVIDGIVMKEECCGRPEFGTSTHLLFFDIEDDEETAEPPDVKLLPSIKEDNW
jgi:hypothetical protein